MSEVKVNKISPRTNCGTVQLGDSGDTITIPAGATITNNGTQTGFGRTGTVDWQTGSIKTSTFTAASGEGYFVDTSSGSVTANLPAGSAGAIVSFSDYTRTFGTNNLVITPNGSEKIGGIAASVYLNVNGQAITLVYVDGTEGWINIQNAEDTETGLVPGFITATGGTITTVCTNFKVHTFTSPGTFTVTSAGNAAGSNTVSYTVVAGGGGGGRGTPANAGGGGGAGGYRESKASSDSYTASPLNATSGPTFNLPVSAQGYPIAVGGGGAGGTGPNVKGVNGVNSSFSSITSAGGGGGGAQGGSQGPALTGGSGGGHGGGARGCGAAGNTPPVSPPQGQPGGKNDCFPSSDQNGAGGGGATVAGGGTDNPTPKAGDGGAGATTSINGTPTARAGGGGGGPGVSPGAAAGAGGAGGGGAGSATCGVTGTANTGGGGGGSRDGGDGGVGGSGVVIIRYKFQ